MPCTVITVYKRPSTMQLWHNDVFTKGNVNPDFLKAAYEVGMFKKRNVENIDELTLRIEVEYPSRQAYDEYMAIPAVKTHFDFIKMYNDNMGIIVDSKEFIET